MKLTENEKKHLVNTIILALPRQDESFDYQIINFLGPSGFEMQGLSKPRFGTIGAGQSVTMDRQPEKIGEKRIPLSRFGISQKRSYCEREYLIFMTENSFNRLQEKLNTQEKEILDSSRGYKRLYRWDGSRFKSYNDSQITQTLSDKILSVSTVKVKKVKANQEPVYT